MCIRCKDNNIEEDVAAHVVNDHNCVIVIKNVPCLVCEHCGERYYTDEVAEKIELIMKEVKKLVQEVAVIDYRQIA